MKLATLHYSENLAEGYVNLTQEFSAMPDDVVKLDILQDWLADLNKLYNKTHKTVFAPKRKE
jgi:hypothetical protein